MKNRRNFVIAHYTYDHNNQLSCYTYHGDVQFGDADNAEFFLEYVKEQAPKQDWRIFWIDTDRDESETPEEIRESLKKDYEDNKEKYDEWSKHG